MRTRSRMRSHIVAYVWYRSVPAEFRGHFTEIFTALHVEATSITMADRNNKDKDTSKVTTNSQNDGSKKEKHDKPGQSAGHMPTTAKKANLPNSTATSDSGTANKSRKKQPPKKVETDLDSRMTKLESLLITQAENNKTFQHNILSTLNSMMMSDDMSDTGDATGPDKDGDNDHFMPQSGTDHQISDSDDELPGPSTSASSKDVQSPSVVDSVDVKTHKQEEGGNPPDDQDDIGFAASFAIEKDIGEPIRSDVAKSLRHGLMYKLEDKKLKETMDKHKCPSNCEPLQLPMINPPIWSDITPNTRSRDLKLQRVQRPLIKGLMALSKLDKNFKLNQDVRDGFMLLANANYEMNCLRKELIKPDLNPQFHHLCRPLTEERARKEKLVPSREYCSLLFGTDLGKQVKDIQEERKATSGVMKRKQFRSRPGPYNKNLATRQGFQAAAAAAGWKSNTNPFLGKQNKKQSYFMKNRNQTQRQDQNKPTNNSPKTTK